jgi:hypothetical protein
MALYNQKFDLPLGYIEEHVTLADFTDGGSAAGTYTMKSAIPAKAHVLATVLTNVTAFAGTTTTITVGDGSDVDRYNTGTPSVFATAAAVDMGAPSGIKGHATAVNPVLTVTAESDFTAVTAGALDIRIVYVKGV